MNDIHLINLGNIFILSHRRQGREEKDRKIVLVEKMAEQTTVQETVQQ